MQFGTGIGAQTDDVAGVGGYFRLVEDDGKHVQRAALMI
jgi:hypothetical protein